MCTVAGCVVVLLPVLHRSRRLSMYRLHEHIATEFWLVICSRAVPKAAAWGLQETTAMTSRWQHPGLQLLQLWEWGTHTKRQEEVLLSCICLQAVLAEGLQLQGSLQPQGSRAWARIRELTGFTWWLLCIFLFRRMMMCSKLRVFHAHDPSPQHSIILTRLVVLFCRSADCPGNTAWCSITWCDIAWCNVAWFRPPLGDTTQDVHTALHHAASL